MTADKKNEVTFADFLRIQRNNLCRLAKIINKCTFSKCRSDAVITLTLVWAFLCGVHMFFQRVG